MSGPPVLPFKKLQKFFFSLLYNNERGSVREKAAGRLWRAKLNADLSARIRKEAFARKHLKFFLLCIPVNI